MAQGSDPAGMSMMTFLLPGYPWHGAQCGDLDLTGYRKPQSYYRDILWNGGDRVHAAVRLPEPEGKEPKQTVGKWRQRFVAKRLDGLLDEPRPGTPRKLSDAEVKRVLALTLESVPTDPTHWSTRSLAKASGLSRAVCIAFGRPSPYSPHRTETSNCPRIRCSSTRCGTSWACT